MELKIGDKIYYDDNYESSSLKKDTEYTISFITSMGGIRLFKNDGTYYGEKMFISENQYILKQRKEKLNKLKTLIKNK